LPAAVDATWLINSVAAGKLLPCCAL